MHPVASICRRRRGGNAVRRAIPRADLIVAAVDAQEYLGVRRIARAVRNNVLQTCQAVGLNPRFKTDSSADVEGRRVAKVDKIVGAVECRASVELAGSAGGGT